MNEKREPVLTAADRGSETWRKLKAHLETRLATLRASNDNSLDERKTAKLRGRIAEVKYLLSLGEDKPMPETDEDLGFKD